MGVPMQRQNWHCWNRLPHVIVKEGIVEFLKKLTLYFGLFDDGTQIRLCGDTLTAELTISSNLGKNIFG